VDFYQVDLKEKIESEVPLELEGTVDIVTKGEADLNMALHQLKIECLPTDLPASIKVDLSVLKEIDDEIRVRDLKLPPGVEVRDEPDELVVKVNPHREEVEEVVAAPAPAEVPTVGETEAAAEPAPEGGEPEKS
jgi:large subunit ribosomal protein L25